MSIVGATIRTVPVDRFATGRGHVRHLPGLDLRKVGGGDLGTPFEAAAPDQAEQFLPRGSTAPTVAVRAEITPSSGASTCV